MESVFQIDWPNVDMQTFETKLFYDNCILFVFAVWRMASHAQASLYDCCLNVRQCIFLLSGFYTQQRCVLWCLHSDTLFLSAQKF